MGEAGKARGRRLAGAPRQEPPQALLAPEGAGALKPRRAGGALGLGRRREAEGAAAAGGVAGLGPYSRALWPPTSLSCGGGSSRRSASGSAPGRRGRGSARRLEWGRWRSSGWLSEYTEAEDKSIRLGLFLIISGVVSLFIFGFAGSVPRCRICKPRQPTARCCRCSRSERCSSAPSPVAPTAGAPSQYPCVQVYVNNSESNSRALLHSDEHQP